MPGKQFLFFALLAALIITNGLTWYLTSRQGNARTIEDTLQPITMLLKEDRGIIDALQQERAANAESGLLSAYLEQIRADGMPKHSATKQRLDALVTNNTLITALLSKYGVRAKTAAFRPAANQFVDYAARFRDRWQSVAEIFMAGGNLPLADPEYPKAFQQAIDAEIAALR